MKTTTNNLLGTMIIILSLSFVSHAQNRTDLSSTHSWQQCKSIPVKMTPATVRIGDKIYFFDASPDLHRTASLYEYDVKQNNWKEKTRASIPRYDFSIVSLNGKIYVIGGIIDSSKTPTSLVEEYDPVKDKWQVKSPMPTVRYGTGICIYKDKIYVFGGFVRRHVQTDIIEMYDPKTDKWTKKSSLPQQMAYNSPILINNTMYMSYKECFYKYNPELDKWTDSTSSHKINNCRFMVPILVNDKIYAICLSSTNRKDGVSHLVKYDPVTDTWENLKDLPHFRLDYSIEALKGKIYIFGGWSEDYRKALNTCEMYDVETDIWEKLPDMSVPRVGMGIQKYNNSIFIFGGMNGYDDDANKRVYYSNVEVLITSQGSIKKSEIIQPDSQINIASSQNKHPYASDKSIPYPIKFVIPNTNVAQTITFTPDGKSFYFVTQDSGPIVIKYSTFTDGQWSNPKLASFCGSTSVEVPFISPDGKRIYFYGQGSINYCENENSSWGTPKKFQFIEEKPGIVNNYPTQALNGNFYFVSNRDGGLKIYVSVYENGFYKNPEKLDNNVNMFRIEPFIAPDESYILFTSYVSNDNLDLYIRFHVNNSWTPAINLGKRTNTSDNEFRPCVSPDGNYLFFTRRKTNQPPQIYQVDWKPILDSLKNSIEVNTIVGQEKMIEMPSSITFKDKTSKVQFSKTPPWLKLSLQDAGSGQLVVNKIITAGLKKGKYTTRVKVTDASDVKNEHNYSVTLNLYEPVPALNIKNLQSGLRYEYYEDTSFTTLPDFKMMKPKKTGLTENINLSIKDRDTLFAAVYSGYINIHKTAVHTFSLTSDDGSKLYIDDKLLIDNDGLHGTIEKSENCCLEKGFHKIRVEYMQGRLGSSLGLNYEVNENITGEKASPENKFFYK